MAENCEGILRLHGGRNPGRKAYLGRTKGNTADNMYLQEKQPTLVSNHFFLSHMTVVRDIVKYMYIITLPKNT